MYYFISCTLFYVLNTKNTKNADFTIVAKDGLFSLSIVTSLQLICDVTRTKGTGIVTSYSSIVRALHAQITLTPYMVLPLFVTRFAYYAGGIRVSFIQPHLFLIWYKMFCVRDISYRLIWMEFINMFSVCAHSGTNSRFNWWIIVVLTYNHSVLLCVEITDAPKL